MRKLWRSAAVLIVGVAVGVGIALLVKSLRTSESDRVKETATVYLQAFATNNAAGLCSEISPAGRAQLQVNAISCEQAASATIARVPKADREALREPQVTVVSIDGNRAAVRFSPKLGGRGDMQLIKLGDQWLVNS